ncbi:hypothetical protein J6590_003335 [Homalodisca vitripennis]|nr:hypothetical protein J6590_003335 [Homalodisca vitripennis]
MSTVLTKLDDLLGKVKKIDDIFKDTVDIKTEITTIRASLSVLEPRVEVIEKNLLAAENQIADVKSQVLSNTTRLNKIENSPATSLDAVVAEVHDRAGRTKNILMYAIPESTKSLPLEKKEDDRKKICTVFDAVNFQPTQFSYHRVGKKSNRGPRPLKIVLGSQNEVSIFMKNFSGDKVSLADPSMDNVSVSRDRTPNERATLTALRKELDERVANGETGITINDRSYETSVKASGGGVLLAVKCCYPSLRMPISTASVEQTLISVTISAGVKVLAGVVYIPPDASVNSYETYVT